MSSSIGGYNFALNVMQNGIGGVNCGGLEGDVQYRDNLNTLVFNAKVYDFLMKHKNKANAIRDKYLVPVSNSIIADNYEIDKVNRELVKKRNRIKKKISNLKVELKMCKAKETSFNSREIIYINEEIFVLLTHLKEIPKNVKRDKVGYKLSKFAKKVYLDRFEITFRVMEYIELD